MKLKEGFILRELCGENIVVATGEASQSFNGMIRSNETAKFIFDQLMQETTEEEIVAAMAKEYEAPKEVLEEDVHALIQTIREAGILDE
ncbi:MAG: PqqD family protein [Clostridia bacterium]|nr:PqqD family protein [Clostridia bacterium]